MKRIRHLLLDLGGILYRVEYHRTGEALHLPRQALATLLGDPTVCAYEKGLLSTEAFIAHWRKRFPHFSEEELINAWNAMLLGPLPQAEAILKELSRHFSIAILSNTNALHLSIVEPEILPWSLYVEDMFFSHHLHKRKPEPEIYQEVIKALGWSPEKTLFIDDNEVNVEGAQKAGLKGYHFFPPNQPENLLAIIRDAE
ncbi:MAG: HAD family phosphatase [Bacteroidia bacterium]|nr:HAD family phosphatase [Bacteroidia bacterium]MDW8015854.1 HAD family phosphatase [Bacteroidia bacterium]